MSKTTYKVKLHRTINDAKIGPTVKEVIVQASTSIEAKNTAESMSRGYRAERADAQR